MVFECMTYSKHKMIRIQMLNEHQNIGIVLISPTPGKIATTSLVKSALRISYSAISFKGTNSVVALVFIDLLKFRSSRSAVFGK